MSIVTTAVYSPIAPPEAPMTFRTFLRCMMSRVTIMSVRRMLRERQIEKYEVATLTVVAVSRPVVDPFLMYTIPIPTPISLANVSPAHGGLEHVPTDARYIRHGNDTTQKFIE